MHTYIIIIATGFGTLGRMLQRLMISTRLAALWGGRG